MSAEAKPSILLARGFPPEPASPDFAGWFEAIPLRDVEACAVVAPPPRSPVPSVGSSERARPSDPGHGSLPGAALFSESAGLAFGTAVHEALSGIEWFPCAALPASLSPAAAEILHHFLATPEIAPVFERPSQKSEVWRERSVACRLEGTIYSGQMDRVVVTPPASKTRKGRILLVDFKTDQGEPAEIALRHKAQLEIYARILAAWSGGRHEIVAAVATVRKPALVRIC
ncbi:MAG: hypothetical protein WC076_07165 [Terrimicrobiaceae bacterium]|jgi:hypothetical protein